MKQIPSIIEQGKSALEEIEQYKKGKLTFRTYKVNMPIEQINKDEVKHIREDILHVSQKVLAECIGVSVRTVQGWEIGKSKPVGSARRLLYLLATKPEVRQAILISDITISDS